MDVSMCLSMYVCIGGVRMVVVVVDGGGRAGQHGGVKAVFLSAVRCG